MRKAGDRVTVDTADVRRFWEEHPLSAEAIPFEPGTREFFEEHDRLRGLVEPVESQQAIYEWQGHAGERLLDVGCGTGFVVGLYARGSARVTGVDLTARGLHLTRQRLALRGFSNSHLLQGDAERLPFRDGSFDMVTSFGVLHHTPDTRGAVREVMRVLRPHGRLILMFYNRNSVAFRFLFPLQRLLYAKWRGRRAEDQVNAVDGAENPLGKVFSKRELAAWLDGDVERLDFSTGDLYIRRPHWFPTAVADWMARRWGWLLYVKAYKRSR